MNYSHSGNKEYDYYYVYLIVNKVNGHYYYGVHSTNNLNDGYMGSGVKLEQAFKKYGRGMFEKKILKFFDSMYEAYKYESEIITLDDILSKKCYNCAPGGNYMFKSLVEDSNGEILLLDNNQIKEEHVILSNKNHRKKIVHKIENDKIIRKYVTIEEVDDYLNNGWILGNKNPAIKGYVHMNNGVNIVMIPPKLVQSYLDAGWKFGNFKANQTKGKKCMHKIIDGEIKNKFVEPEDVFKYENDGWIMGKMHRKTPKRNKERNIHIHKEIDGKIKNKVVTKDEYEKYINDGWEDGVYRRDKFANRKVVYKIENGEYIQKIIEPSDFESYIQNGWKFGSPKNNDSKGTIGLHKKYEDGSFKNIKIRPEDLEKYLSDGWLIGHYILNAKSGTTGKVFVSKIDEIKKYTIQ